MEFFIEGDKMKYNKAKAISGIILSGVIAFSSAITTFATKIENEDVHILAYNQNIDGQPVLVKNDSLVSDSFKVNYPLLKASALPSKYNLNDYGYVTNPKSQVPYGACWSFAALSAFESNIIKSGNATKDNIDLSEKHLIWFNYNGKDNSSDKSLYAGNDTNYDYGYSPFYLGGNIYMAASTLMRRYGAVSEEKVPYTFESMSVSEEFKNISEIYLKDVYILPETVDLEWNNSGEVTKQELFDNQTVQNSIQACKQAIMDYGAVNASYYCSDAMTGTTNYDIYWNADHCSYYFDAKLNGEANMKLQNHAITIVGWDDSFSKNNFTKTPPADGAWIVKNSWGDDWGLNGYFYLSYYDLSFSTPSVLIAEDTEYKSDGTTQHEYKNIYQYDGVGFADGQITTTGKLKAANYFTARDNEILEAVSTISTQSNITVNYEVYTNPTSHSDPTSGTLVSSGSKSFVYAGYHTVDINPVYLEKGTEYAVVVQISFKSGDYNFNILPVETVINSPSSVDVQANQSAVFTKGTWKGITENSSEYGYKIGNAIIKAYTNDATLGDINQDELLNISDATLIQKYVIGIVSLSNQRSVIGDVDKNNVINIADATYIQKKIAGLI